MLVDKVRSDFIISTRKLPHGGDFMPTATRQRHESRSGRRQIIRLCTGVLLGMSLLSWQLSHLPPAQASNSCTVSPILVNSCRPWLGAAAENYPQAASGTESQVLYHEQRIGRQLDIVHTYHSVGQNSLTSADVYFATRPNTILLTDWNPTNNWADIASQNAAIDQMATSIAAVSPAKVMVALSHEPENNVSPGGEPNCPSLAYQGTDGTVADYRNMWAYVENRFAADGVTNVVWVMDYMNDPTWQCLVNDLYPGDNLVDWILFNEGYSRVPPKVQANYGRDGCCEGINRAAVVGVHDAPGFEIGDDPLDHGTNLPDLLVELLLPAEKIAEFWFPDRSDHAVAHVSLIAGPVGGLQSQENSGFVQAMAVVPAAINGV